MSLVTTFIITVGLIVVSTTLGYVARRMRWVSERLAEKIMTFIYVLGYSSVGFFAIWALPLKMSDMWLPLLGTLDIVVMLALGLGIGRLFSRDRGEVGLFGIATSVGNNGFTMGGFIVYLLYGSEGLGLVNILGLMWTPTTVLLLYPIAQACSGHHAGKSLRQLIWDSLFDWRSIGLPMAAGAIVLSLCQVPYPRVVFDWHILDAMMFVLTPLAYFGIGLRLHVGRMVRFWPMILALAGTRFVLGAAVGLGIVALTLLTPWPLDKRSWNIFLIEAFVPTAITMVAVCNMFRLKPREASALLVTNTALYLAAVLPLVLWWFR